MSSNDDEFDQRFRELIRAEFGDVAGSRGPNDADPPPLAPAPVPPRRFGARKLRDPIEYFNLSQAIEQSEPDDDFERWRPPGESILAHPPKARVAVGIVLLVICLLVGVVVLAGWRPVWWIGLSTVLVAGAGLALLLSALPRTRDDGDGARL